MCLQRRLFKNCRDSRIFFASRHLGAAIAIAGTPIIQGRLQAKKIVHGPKIYQHLIDTRQEGHI